MVHLESYQISDSFGKTLVPLERRGEGFNPGAVGSM
jgi:hypothetical protein